MRDLNKKPSFQGIPLASEKLESQQTNGGHTSASVLNVTIIVNSHFDLQL